MINDPGKNLISCPVVQGWFPIKELTQDNYFLSTVPNLLFNRGHSSLSVWKQNQFLNLHLVNIPKDHWMLNLEGTLMALSLSLLSSCSSHRSEGEGWHSHHSADTWFGDEGSVILQDTAWVPRWTHYGVTFNETVNSKLGTNHHGRMFLQLQAQAKYNPKTSIRENLQIPQHNYYVQLPPDALNTQSRCNELSWFELHVSVSCTYFSETPGK